MHLVGIVATMRAMRLVRPKRHALISSWAAAMACPLFVQACVAPRTSGPAESLATAPKAQAIELVPTRSGATAYGQSVNPPLARTEVVDAIQRVVHELGRELKRPEVRWDDRLGLVAVDLARVAPEDGPLDYEVVEFALSHYGIVEPTPHLFVVWATRAPPEAVAAHIREQIREMVAEGSYTRLGIGVVERAKERAVIAVALQTSAVEVEPVPRRLALSGHAWIKGRVLRPYDKPEVLISREDGSVSPVGIERAKDRFVSEVQCGKEIGKVQVEISATGPEGALVLANFPVWCGVDPPKRFSFVPAGARVAKVGSAEAEAKLVELINRDRRGAGLAPLKVDAQVAAVARAYSVEMARTGVVAHVSPESGTASDRLAKAGIRRPLIEENLARSSSVESAHQSLMNSPGHRANILSPGVTQVGVGVIGAAAEAGSTDLIVTEVFVRVPAPVDRESARSRVLTLLSEHYHTVEDRQLAALAQQAAEDVARLGTGEADGVQKVSGMEAAAQKFRRLRALLVAVADIDQLTLDNLPKDLNRLRVGIGVGQGSHPKMGPSTIYLVLLVAEPT